MEAFSKMLAIMILVYAIIGWNLIYYSDKEDLVVQNFVAAKTNEFVDEVKNQGKITSTMYDDYLRQLDSTNMLFSVELEHDHESIYPVYDDNGNFLNSVDTTDNMYYTDQILSDVYGDNSEYLMAEGDYFSITVTSTSKSLGQQVREAILHKIDSGSSIYFTYGGMILDENY